MSGGFSARSRSRAVLLTIAYKVCQRKQRDFIELVSLTLLSPTLPDRRPALNHLIRAVQDSNGVRRCAARRVLITLPRHQYRLVAHPAGSDDLLHFSHPVGDHPVPADQLHRVSPFVRNLHGVEKEPLALLWA